MLNSHLTPPPPRDATLARAKGAALEQALIELGLKELRDGDVLSKALAAAGLEDEIASGGVGLGGLEGAGRQGAVEGVAGAFLPAVEDEGDGGGLALGLDADVGLEAEGVDDGQKTTDSVEWSASDRAIREDMASPAR